jgi:hypothetical protein
MGNDPLQIAANRVLISGMKECTKGLYPSSSNQQGNATIILTIRYCSVGFEVLTEVAIKSYIFCDITPCSPFKVHGRFEGTRPSIFKVKQCVKQAVNRACFVLISCLTYSFNTEDGGEMFLRNAH